MMESNDPKRVVVNKSRRIGRSWEEEMKRELDRVLRSAFNLPPVDIRTLELECSPTGFQPRTFLENQ